jgi:hypothetical protein
VRAEDRLRGTKNQREFTQDNVNDAILERAKRNVQSHARQQRKSARRSASSGDKGVRALHVPALAF